MNWMYAEEHKFCRVRELNAIPVHNPYSPVAPPTSMADTFGEANS